MVVYDASLIPPQPRVAEDFIGVRSEGEAGSAGDAAEGHGLLINDRIAAEGSSGGGAGAPLKPQPTVRQDVDTPPKPQGASGGGGSKMGTQDPLSDTFAIAFAEFMRRDEVRRIERGLLARCDCAADGDAFVANAVPGAVGGAAVEPWDSRAAGCGCVGVCRELARMHAAVLRFADTGAAVKPQAVAALPRGMTADKVPDYLGGRRRSDTAPGQMARIAGEKVAAAMKAGVEAWLPETGPDVEKNGGIAIHEAPSVVEMLQFADEDLRVVVGDGPGGVTAQCGERMLREWTYHVAQLMWRYVQFKSS